MYFTFYIDVTRLSIFIFPYRYDVVRNMKSFGGKNLFFFSTYIRVARGVIKRKSPGKWTVCDFLKPRGIAGKKCAIRMPSFHCYSRWRATAETQFNQVRCSIDAALKIATWSRAGKHIAHDAETASCLD